MAKSPAEHYREFAVAIATLDARADHSRDDVALVRQQLDDERALGRERDRVIAELRRDNDLLRQQLHEHLKRVDTWSAWVRSLISGLIFAVLGLASGLVVALVKR